MNLGKRPRGSKNRVSRSDEAASPAQTPIDPQPDAANVADYIAQMTGELARMVGAAKLDVVTYFLNMARIEAESHRRRK